MLSLNKYGIARAQGAVLALAAWAGVCALWATRAAVEGTEGAWAAVALYVAATVLAAGAVAVRATRMARQEASPRALATDIVAGAFVPALVLVGAHDPALSVLPVAVGIFLAARLVSGASWRQWQIVGLTVLGSALWAEADAVLHGVDAPRSALLTVLSAGAALLGWTAWETRSDPSLLRGVLVATVAVLVAILTSGVLETDAPATADAMTVFGWAVALVVGARVAPDAVKRVRDAGPRA